MHRRRARLCRGHVPASDDPPIRLRGGRCQQPPGAPTASRASSANDRLNLIHSRTRQQQKKKKRIIFKTAHDCQKSQSACSCFYRSSLIRLKYFWKKNQEQQTKKTITERDSKLNRCAEWFVWIYCVVTTTLFFFLVFFSKFACFKLTWISVTWQQRRMHPVKKE